MNTETFFWTCIALLAYTYAGYPLLIALTARLRGRPVMKRAQLPAVSVILVVRNGARWIEEKLSNCLTLDYPYDLLKIVVVCDGCDDDTAERVRRFESPRIRLIERAEPRGKAACLNEAVAHGSGDILVFTDVRQRLDRNVIHALAQNFADPSVGAVSGELMLDPAQNGFAGGMDLYWRYEKFIRNSEAKAGSSVGVTGALYALRQELYEPVPEHTVLDDVLIPMNVVCRGYRVVFEPAAIAYDVPSSNRQREQRRKVRTIAGNYQLALLKPALLNPLRNPLWLEYFSHKLLRLAVPLFLAGALVANALLAVDSRFYQALLAAQLALYAVALAGILLPAAQRLRLVRVPSTFLLLNWFAVLGFFNFARHGRKLPW